MIQNVIFRILLLEILFRAYHFFIFAQMQQRTSSEFFLNFRFSSTKSQSQGNLGKKIAHFTIQFRQRNITHFTNRDSLDTEKICCRSTAKHLFDFKDFPAGMFLLSVRENICTAPFLDTQELQFLKHFESKCLYISVYLRKKMFFQRRSNILSDESGLMEG